jgi:tRNA-dihydrouridine synthase
MQFYTTKAPRLAEALRHVAGKGLFGADINFGCSAPNIRKAGGGVAWMRDPAGAAALVALARGAWPAVLSAKLRLGETDDYGVLRDFAKGLAGAGLDFLTLHPRLEDQKFRRQGRWDYVGRLQEDLDLPVVGNGDVTSHSAYARRRVETGCAGIMIGRGAVRRPWLFALIKGKEADPGFELRVDREATALRFLDLVEARLHPDFHLTRAQRFFFHYADNFSFAHHLKWQLENAPDLAAMRSILAAYFAEVPKDRVVVESD